MDAAVPLKRFAAAVSCSLDDKGRINLDPSRGDLEQSSSAHTFAFDTSQQDGLIAVESVGTYTREQLLECYDLAQSASTKVAAFSGLGAEKSFKKDYNVE